MSLQTYCDAVWAIFIDAPFERLEKIQEKLIVQEAIADPDTARKTWGMLPEHQAGMRRAEEMQTP